MIKNLRNNRAYGEVGIVAELLEYVGQSLVVALKELIEKIAAIKIDKYQSGFWYRPTYTVHRL